LSGVEGVRSERRRVGREAEERKARWCNDHRARNERGGMVMDAGDAQQGVAPERGPRNSHDHL
jgi:hypothetical protein